MTLSNETQQNFLNILPAVLYEYVLYEDRTSEFLYMSPAAKEMLGHSPQYFTQDTNRFWGMVHPDDIDKLYNDDVTANTTKDFFVSEIRISLPSGQQKWIQLSSKPTSNKKNNSAIWSGYIIDVSAQKKAEEERNQLIISLQSALDEIKTLKGIIPICSYCHNIRDVEGAWNKLEIYLSTHSDAELSHGICPKCLPKVRAESGLDK